MKRKEFLPIIQPGTDRSIKFTISTGSPDRDQDTLSPSGWLLDNYRRNPVVLYGHDSHALPIGRCTYIAVEGDALRAVAEFTPADLNPMGDTVYRMLKAGFLKGTSVGFTPVEYEPSADPLRPNGYDFRKQELLEFSIVPIPANADALVERAKSAGINVTPIQVYSKAFGNGRSRLSSLADQMILESLAKAFAGAMTLRAFGAGEFASDGTGPSSSNASTVTPERIRRILQEMGVDAATIDNVLAELNADLAPASPQGGQRGIIAVPKTSQTADEAQKKMESY